ncbi:MAG: hypothetical protein V2A74_04250, partial [bacterium]
HIKTLTSVGLLCLILLLELRNQKPEKPPLWPFALAAWLLTFLSLVLYFIIYRHWDMNPFFAGPREFTLGSFMQGFPGLLFDQQFGLFPYTPVLILCFVGFGLIYREDRWLFWYLVALIASVYLPLSVFHYWGGAGSPSVRYQAAFAPLLIFPMSYFLRDNRSRLFWSLLALLLVISLTNIAVLFSDWDLAFNRESYWGTNRYNMFGLFGRGKLFILYGIVDWLPSTTLYNFKDIVALFLLVDVAVALTVLYWILHPPANRTRAFHSVYFVLAVVVVVQLFVVILKWGQSGGQFASLDHLFIEAETLQGNIGTILSNPGVSGGQVRAGETTAAGGDFLTRGPYVDLPPGFYAADFCLKAQGPEDKDEWVALEVFANGHPLVRRLLGPKDFSGISPVDIHGLKFYVSETAKSVEFRIYLYPGTVAWADWIYSRKE